MFAECNVCLNKKPCKENHWVMVPDNKGMCMNLKLEDLIVKPWGKEMIIEANDNYVVKRIMVNEGKRLSLQYHEKKHETMVVISGSGYIIIGDEILRAKTGSFFVIKPGVKHRLCADWFSSIVVIETSTPELDDVIRIEDDYGRIE